MTKTIVLLGRAVFEHCNALATVPPLPGTAGLKAGRVQAMLRPDAERIASAHNELLAEFAHQDADGPVMRRDANGDIVEGQYRLDPARRKERLAQEKAMWEQPFRYRVELITQAELTMVFSGKREIAPDAMAALLTFAEPTTLEPESE